MRRYLSPFSSTTIKQIHNSSKNFKRWRSNLRIVTFVLNLVIEEVKKKKDKKDWLSLIFYFLSFCSFVHQFNVKVGRLDKKGLGYKFMINYIRLCICWYLQEVFMQSMDVLELISSKFDGLDLVPTSSYINQGHVYQSSWNRSLG